MAIGRFLSAFQPDETDQELWRRFKYEDLQGREVVTDHYTLLTGGEESFARVAFSRAIIGDAHLYRISSSQTFCATRSTNAN